jgi:hypothetical protein
MSLILQKAPRTSFLRRTGRWNPAPVRAALLVLACFLYYDIQDSGSDAAAPIMRRGVTGVGCAKFNRCNQVGS